MNCLCEQCGLVYDDLICGPICPHDEWVIPLGGVIPEALRAARDTLTLILADPVGTMLRLKNSRDEREALGKILEMIEAALGENRSPSTPLSS